MSWGCAWSREVSETRRGLWFQDMQAWRARDTLDNGESILDFRSLLANFHTFVAWVL